MTQTDCQKTSPYIIFSLFFQKQEQIFYVKFRHIKIICTNSGKA